MQPILIKDRLFLPIIVLLIHSNLSIVKKNNSGDIIL
jgi:hypothetical protein